MGILNRFFNQTRKPEGILGKLMVNGMNNGHAKMADWGMSHLPEMKPGSVLDVGCGGGRNAGALAKRYPEAAVTAIDYSDVSVRKAAEYNNAMIGAGRIKVMQGDVSKLIFPAESFDLATAFETIYFWPGLEKCFAQVAKTLRPGGYFLICNESDGVDKTGKKFEKIIEGMKCYTVDEIEKALTSAGFSSVQSDHYSNKPWITVLARK